MDFGSNFVHIPAQAEQEDIYQVRFAHFATFLGIGLIGHYIFILIFHLSLVHASMFVSQPIIPKSCLPPHRMRLTTD